MKFPKPERRPPKGRRPLRAARWGVRRKPRRVPVDQAFPKPVVPKSKHARRPREWGFMAFCHVRGCELALDVDLQRVLEIVHVCRGRLEFAHLSDKKRYDVGDVGACLCADDGHKGIDGKEGGKASWYVPLDRLAQRSVRMRLANRARSAWAALTPEDQERWERAAALRRRRGSVEE